jgi:hypothetical protein
MGVKQTNERLKPATRPVVLVDAWLSKHHPELG